MHNTVAAQGPLPPYPAYPPLSVSTPSPYQQSSQNSVSLSPATQQSTPPLLTQSDVEMVVKAANPANNGPTAVETALAISMIVGLLLGVGVFIHSIFLWRKAKKQATPKRAVCTDDACSTEDAKGSYHAE
jgi:capsular polysaccharide biosynthesis protein